MSLMRRNPARDMMHLRDTLDRFFDERFFISPWEMEDTGIRMDVLEEGHDIHVKASLPGVKPEDLHVEVEDDRLHIWGESKEEKERKEEDYYLREHRYGRLDRMIRLPAVVDAAKAKAEYKEGVLKLTFPKAAETRRKEIKIVS